MVKRYTVSLVLGIMFYSIYMYRSAIYNLFSTFPMFVVFIGILMSSKYSTVQWNFVIFYISKQSQFGHHYNKMLQLITPVIIFLMLWTMVGDVSNFFLSVN